MRTALGAVEPSHLAFPHLNASAKQRIRAAWIVAALGIGNWAIFTAVTAMLTHHLKPSEFGWYGSAIAACSLAVTAATLGLEKLAIKAIPVFRYHGQFGRWKGFLAFGTATSLVFGAVLGGIAYAVWLLLNHPTAESAELFLRLMYFLPAMALFMFLYEVCSANDFNIRTALVYRLAVPAVMAATIWAMIDHDGDSFTMLDAGLAYGLSWVIGLIAILVWAIRSTPPPVFRASPVAISAGRWILGGFGFVGFSLSMMLIGATPVLVLTAVRSEAEAGTMAVIVQVTSLLIVSITAVTRVFAPRLATALANQDVDLAARVRRVMNLSMLPMVAMFLIACIGFHDSILGAFGAHYQDAGLALTITAVAIAPQAFAYLAPWELQFRGQQRFVLLVAALGAGVGIAALIVLAWWQGIVGAAVGQLIMVTLIFLPMLIRTRRLHRILVRQAAGS